MIDRAFAREFAGQLMLFAVLVALVMVFGSTAIFVGLFSEENAAVSGIPREIDRGILDAAWWTLSYVVRLPAFEEMYGSSGPILFYAIVLSIMGLAVFGVLVSVINNAMRSRIELLQQGDTPVKERNHILILGWDNKVFAVLRQLARLQPGTRVVILANEEMRDMSDALRVAGIPREPLTVILRSGVPSNKDELQRVAVSRASGIIVLSKHDDDSEAIKTLVLLASKNDWVGIPPSLTAEIALERNYELAEIGARNRLHIVSSSRVTSKIVVQTIRNPGLSRVYDELMATEGNRIYVENAKAGSKTLEEFAFGFEQAVPIGISWNETTGSSTIHKAALNPEPDYDLADDENLILIARSSPSQFLENNHGYTSDVFRKRVARSETPGRILLIGWTDELYDILRELNAHAIRGTAVTLLSILDKEIIEERLTEQMRANLTKLSLDLRYGDATERAAYADLDLASYESIVVLTDESTEDGDTRALAVMLRLSEVASKGHVTGSIVVELGDGANRDLFDGLGATDIVVTSEAISAQLAQICRQPVLGSIYRELLSAGGVEISLRPASDYLGTAASFSFRDLIYAAQQNLEIALGLCRSDGEILMNPSRDESWQLDDGDRIIVLAEQIYH